MSRLWDTPEFWARGEVDEILREVPDSDPGALADSFGRTAASYDGEPAMAAAIVSELRRRSTAGVRFWPGPHSIDRLQADEASGRSGPASPVEPTIADLIDDEIPW